VLDTPTYLFIVVVGAILTLVVGQILMRSGYGFLRDVFEDDEVATSTTRLLGVLFHLVALGFLALISTYRPFDVQGTVQIVITQLGGVMLLLGLLHGLTLLLLARIRSRRRSQTLETEMSSQYEQQRRARQTQRQQVIEGGNQGR
jgi:sensor histidine kinase YesM